MYCKRSIFGRLAQICVDNNIAREDILVMGGAAAVFHQLCTSTTSIVVGVPNDTLRSLTTEDSIVIHCVKFVRINRIPLTSRKHRKFNIINRFELSK